VTHARTCAAVGRSVGKENRLQIRLGKNSEQLKEVRRERELLERAYLRHGGRLYKKTRRIPEAERGTLEGPTEADGKTGALKGSTQYCNKICDAFPVHVQAVQHVFGCQ